MKYDLKTSKLYHVQSYRRALLYQSELYGRDLFFVHVSDVAIELGFPSVKLINNLLR